VYVVRKITGRNRYTDMTDHEFEAEAKRTSPAFGLMLAIQLRASDKTTTCIRIFFARHSQRVPSLSVRHLELM
jgi:hypothetical protein